MRFDVLKEYNVEIIETKTIEGFPLGTNFERGETYVDSTIRPPRKFLVKIVDIGSGETKKSIELTAGDFQSPVEYFSPVHVEYIDNRSYIVDQFEKIVAYDENFNHLYSSMFHQLRFFIDFYKYNGQVYFVMGTKKIMHKVSSEIRLYRLNENQKPLMQKSLNHDFSVPALQAVFAEDEKSLNRGFFWPSPHGFEKDGKIYYARNDQQKYHVYDLNTGKTDAFELPYLKPKRFKDSDAHKIGYYKTNGWEELHFKKYNSKVIYKAYPGDIFHFGLYDAGTDAIGVATGIDLDEMTFRMDIIDTKTAIYKKSICFPMSTGFIQSLSASYRGFTKDCFYVEKGFYICHDTVGEDSVDMVKIIKFELKAK